MPARDIIEIQIYPISLERACDALGREGAPPTTDEARAMIERLRRHYALRTQGDVLSVCLLKLISDLPSMPVPAHMQYLTSGATDGR